MSDPSNALKKLGEALVKVLEVLAVDRGSPHPPAAQKAAQLAGILQRRARELQTPQERKQQTELDRMIHSAQDKATLLQMTDQAFRAQTPRRAVDQLVHILDVQGVPRFFSPFDRTMLKGFQSFGAYLPGVAVPLVKEKMHKETANVVLPAEADLLAEHLNQRREEGVRMNVNFLGEALLGEEDARNRLKGYLQALQRPEIEVISVKISTIYSQISSLAREHTIGLLCDRMELLYRASARSHFRRADGTEATKFVYLDMEEYRDMNITAEVFMRTLDRPGLEQVRAGMALQAYVPDSARVQRRVNEWARKRVEGGGAAVTLRLVKGANMEMERVEASLAGWPQAPYRTKEETDTNYKRMLEEGMKPANLAAVRLGIASHNLFDLSYGLVLATEAGALDRVQFEMLEGMANHQRRALFELTRNLLLYAPACRREDFIHAIGYLVRRLDENTGPENFLRHAFNLEVDSDTWHALEDGFFKCFASMEQVSDAPRRRQDRRSASQPPQEQSADWRSFVNEADTDFALPHNVKWAEALVADWKQRCGENAAEIPLVIDGEEILQGRDLRECLDPSRPGVCVGRYRQANAADIDRAVACARADADGWRDLADEKRLAILDVVADEIAAARADLMGAALADGGKILAESDPEVSEAVDFARFYIRSANALRQLPGLNARGRGVVAVVSPWNFPIAIPCGGVAAALAAGNTVILKPASDTVLVAWELCRCFWRAGVSRRALQLVPCSGAGPGQQLVTHPQVDAVVLTGGTETALAMLRVRPGMHLTAETGGKNATVVTALADRDQAIKHVLHSAFGHGGQKCSATSLLMLEEELFADESFRRTLCDAARSLGVGSAWDLPTRVGPLIRPPSGVLDRGLKELEPGESWALMPRRVGDNPHLVSPGIKWGVRPGSFTHMTELFGPVLGVMQVRNLHEAIDRVNQTGYGLTSGLESLDDREQELWREGIRAGNLYVNRPTTGAVVLRQPFGGMGKSTFGPGIKAGGPNYVAQLMHFTEEGEPEGSAELSDPHQRELRQGLAELAAGAEVGRKQELGRVIVAMGSYDLNMEREFRRAHDHFRLIGQDNLRRYRPVRELRIRAHAEDSDFDLLARVCAAKAAGCRITVSSEPGRVPPIVEWLHEQTESWAGAIEFVEESDRELAEVICAAATDRVRYAAARRVPEGVRVAVAQSGLCLADAPVLMEGRIELLWYLQEQSVCFDYHRYGNLGERGSERRAQTV